jgi:Lrp/AsnC family leucine-responsive transcriptional regulator
MEAYILISLKNADEEEVLDRLKESGKVKEAHILFGEWDIIAKIHIQNEQELGTFVMEKIRSLESVDLTSTLIVAK